MDHKLRYLCILVEGGGRTGVWHVLSPESFRQLGKIILVVVMDYLKARLVGETFLCGLQVSWINIYITLILVLVIPNKKVLAKKKLKKKPSYCITFFSLKRELIPGNYRCHTIV